jgi:hypothetical protein
MSETKRRWQAVINQADNLVNLKLSFPLDFGVRDHGEKEILHSREGRLTSSWTRLNVKSRDEHNGYGRLYSPPYIVAAAHDTMLSRSLSSLRRISPSRRAEVNEYGAVPSAWACVSISDLLGHAKHSLDPPADLGRV